MRAKRSKQYKKLIQQYQLHHGFREPYQVLGELIVSRQITLPSRLANSNMQSTPTSFTMQSVLRWTYKPALNGPCMAKSR